MSRRTRVRMRMPRAASDDCLNIEPSERPKVAKIIQRGQSSSYQRMKGEHRKKFEARSVMLPLAIAAGLSAIAGIVYLEGISH